MFLERGNHAGCARIYSACLCTWEGLLELSREGSQPLAAQSSTEDWEMKDWSPVPEVPGLIRGQGDFPTQKCSLYGSLTKKDSKQMT